MRRAVLIKNLVQLHFQRWVGDLEDFAFETNDLRHRIGGVWRRVHAIERSTGTHEIEVVIVTEKDARRGGEARLRRRQLRQRRAETRQLFRIMRVP